MKLNSKFKPLFRLLSNERDDKGKLLYYNDVDTVIMTGGRFSAKSFSVGVFSSIALVDYGWNVLYTRFTNASIVDSVKPEVSSKIDILNMQHLVNDTNTHIECNGNRISFKGIKTGSNQQTANLKSLSGFNCFVNDEAEELPDYKTFKRIFYSIRSSHLRNLNILILNPTTKDHWIYKEFFEKRNVEGGYNGVKDNVMYIHTSYLDVAREHIPDNIYNDFELMKVDSPKEYDNIVLGGWIDEVEGVLIPSSKLKFENIHKYTLNDTVWRFAIADPANKGGDNYSMLFCWVVNVGAHFQIVVRDVIYSKDGIESLTDRIVEKLHENLIEEVLLEVNGVGLASYMLVKREIENHCKAVPFTTKENKEVKILSNYEGVIKYMVFDDNYKSNAEHSNFISHLTSYKRDKNESQNKHKLDAIDNASMAVKAFKLKFANVLYGKK